MKPSRYTFNDLTAQVAFWNNTLQEVGTKARITLGRAYNCTQVYLSEVKGSSPADEHTWTCVRQITSGSTRECLEAGQRVYREELERARTAQADNAIAELIERLKERTAACLESDAKLTRRVRVLEASLEAALTEADEMKSEGFPEPGWGPEARAAFASCAALSPELIAKARQRVAKCPQCGSTTVQPRESEEYCEECGWPDENRAEADESDTLSLVSKLIESLEANEDYEERDNESILIASIKAHIK